MTSLDADVERARARFLAWIRWYMRAHPEDAPTRAALALQLGVTGSAITQWLAPGAARSPSFEALVAARRLIGYPIDVLLFCDPPDTPK